jgi:signal transduction histidine kinase
VQRAELEKRQDGINRKLSEFLSSQESSEASSGLRLRVAITEYWNTLEPVLGWSPEFRLKHGIEFLREEVVPRRQKLVDIIDQIAAIDGQMVQAGETHLKVIYRRLARELEFGSLFIIGVGLLLGFGSIQSVLRLERISENHHREADRARSELRKLNTSLLATVEEERKKLSRELHDQVGQQLSAIVIELGNVESGLPPTSKALREQIKNARGLAETGIAMVRDLALLLRPSMLDDLGLVAALKWHAREVSRRTGVHVEVVAEGIVEELPDEHRTCIYRVVQEAVNNSISHAKPRLVRITLLQRPDEIQVSVQDDGSGFDPQQDKGIGILGMQERVQSLGGRMHIDSKPGSGAVLSLVLPLVELPPV